MVLYWPTYTDRRLGCLVLSCRFGGFADLACFPMFPIIRDGTMDGFCTIGYCYVCIRGFFSENTIIRKVGHHFSKSTKIIFVRWMNNTIIFNIYEHYCFMWCGSFQFCSIFQEYSFTLSIYLAILIRIST